MTSSRFAQRAMGAAAVVTIVLLIIVIALLWTGVGTGVFNTQRTPSEARRSRTGLEPRPQPKEVTTIFSGGGYSNEDSDDEGGDDDDSVTLFDEDVHGDDLNKEWTKQRKLSIDEGGTSAQIEYVKPLKISPPPLHEQDILYGGDFDNTQPPLRHHSGHFRHKMALLWDPHPQYEFSAFGKSFRLVLAQDAAFVHPELQVTHIWHNMTIRERPTLRPNGCFYKGLVRGDPHSTVAVSLCHGMTGHIRTSFGSFFIEPVEHWHDHTTPILHALYRIPGRNNDAAAEVEGLHQCGVADEDYPWRAPAAMTMDPNISSLTSGPVQYVGGKRTRRSMATGEYRRSYTVEILVVADKKMAEYHGDGLQHYILTLMSIVSQIYKDASVGNPISIAVVNLHILKDVEFVPRDSRSRNNGHDGISAAEMLRNFCAWQSTVNTKDDSNTNHHDTSLLLTRENICRNPEKRKCDTLGLAELGKMCDHNSSCAIVQDNGLSAAFTIAHELGHVLNMPHDDDQKCTRYRDGSKIHNVMSRMLDHNTYPWAWSECSQQVLTEFLDAGYGRCLLDKPFRDLVSAEQARRHSQPGESFPEDRQCQLVFGESSRICSYMPVCKRLWCTTDPSEKEGCRTQYMPWADGTPCAPGRWCQRGECVNRTQLPKVDGGWGSWQPFGDCSRSCGGGVKRSERKCNNPAPSNGGDYCTGQRTRYRSCNMRACPPGSRDYREEQCAAFNNNTFNIQGLPENVKWVPKYGIFSSDERCKLYCRVQGNSAYYPLREKVGDGTSCGPDTFDMCVNGICRQAGCDHVLGSRRKLDMCGKCGGDNSSCVPIKGSYNNSKYGYSSVVRIPAGSSNLDIKQYGHNGLNDDNYLALRDEENGQYILNGEYMVTIFRKLVVFDGGTLEYSGSSAIIERINSSSRPLKKSLIVEVLSVGSLTPPNITYQYTVQRDSHFKWELGDKWTDCDKPCNGKKWLWPVCVQLDNSVLVSDEHCANLADDQLERPVEPCNTHCTLKWRSKPVSECSAECGRGTRTMSVDCVQEFGESKMVTVTDDAFCEYLPQPPEQEDCEGPCNSTHWDYGEWGPCPVTCGGGGVHSRMVQCVNERGQPVEASLCSEEPAPITERNCGIQECPQWVLGQLSPCSVSCGAGERTHSLWCQVGEQMVTEVYCEALPKPRDYKESCTLEPCASWQLGPWNQCSVTCGGSGKQTRIVRCISLEGHEVDDSACYGEERPSETKPCEADEPCPNDYYGSILGSSTSTTSASLEDDWQHHNSMFPTESSYIDNSIPHGNREDNNVLPPIARKLFHPQHKIPFIPQPAATWVVSDWEPCSVTCGKGVKRRSVSCADTVLGTPVDRQQCHMLADNLEPSVTEPCGENLPPCASWQVGDWEPCSVTCGKGITKRKMVCINKENGVLENEKVCEENNLARPIKEKECEKLECHNEPQFKWRTGPWGECSKSCGGGHMRRMVVCASEDGDTSEEKCSTSERLVDKVQCNIEPCPTWNTGAWSECSKTCGEGGYQQRQVRCQLHSGGILLDSACSTTERPPEERKCNHVACPGISYIDSGQGDRPYVSKKVYQWRTGAWGQCSKSCGKGLRNRQVACVAVTLKEWRVVEQYYPPFRTQQKKIQPSEIVVRDIHCNPAQRPKATRICRQHQCPYAWVEGEWSECSQTCGHGMRQRTVGCYKVAGRDWQPRTSELCDASEKPADQEACILAHCHDEYHWDYGAWLPCSHECGKKGRQKRHLFCRNREGKKVRRNLCAQDKKPQHKRKCNQHRCVYSSCLDAQTRLRTKDDKEYLMRVTGSSAMAHIRIFCHGMASDNPKEYLTLAAGERDNFAEIYDRRLESPGTCPFNGQRRDNCPCKRLDPQDKWGLTVFSKIRLNITSLRVITQDFTFSRQVKGQRVKYAEAGDCYSKVRCPQGRFSINLQGTGLQVSPDTRWEGHGSDPHIIINRTEGNVKVDGKCGGYCGTCSPNVQHGLKLDVLPP